MDADEGGESSPNRGQDLQVPKRALDRRHIAPPQAVILDPPPASVVYQLRLPEVLLTKWRVIAEVAGPVCPWHLSGDEGPLHDR